MKVNTTSKQQPHSKLKANLSVTIAQSCVSSGTHLTTQFPSYGLGEPVAYGFQTLAKGAVLQCSRKHYEILPPRPGFELRSQR